MKKFLKIILILFTVSAIFLISAAVAVRFFFPAEKAKALFIKYAESHWRRRVQLGKVSIGLFSGLTIADFKLSEQPDFSQGTFVSSAKLSVRPRLLPLLSKKIFIKEVELVHPEIAITRYADGKTYNFSDLQASSEASSASHQSSAPSSPPVDHEVSPLPFLVSRARIESGVVRFQDRSPANQSIDIRGLNLEAGNVSLAGPMDLKLDVEVKSRGIEAGLAFQGSLQYLKGLLQIDRCRLSARGPSKEESVVNITGRIRDVITVKAESKPILDLKADIESLQASLLAAFAPLPADVSVSGPLSGQASFTGTAAQLNFSVLMKLDQVNLSYGASFKKPAGHPMSFQADGTFAPPARVDFNGLKMTLGAVELAGTGHVGSESKTAPTRFDLKSNSFPLEELAATVPPVRDYQLKGHAIVAARIVGSEVTGTVVLKDAGLSYQHVLLTNLQAPVDFTMDSVSAPKLTGKLNGSDFSANLSAKKSISRPAIAAVQAAIPPAASSPIDFSGTLSAAEVRHDFLKGKNLRLEWKLAGVTADLDKMSGTASLRHGAGEIQNIQKIMEGSKATRMFLLPVALLQKLDKATKGVLKLPPLDRISFQEILGDYTFRSGLMNVERFNMNGAQVSADMKGTIGLSGVQKVDLRAVLKMPEGTVRGAVGQILRDDQGRVTIAMNVGGTVAEPAVEVETSEIKQKTIEKIKEKVGEEKFKKYEDLLKGLLR